jgi:formylglycine-generating enzyme required for sulfatase activity
VTVQQYAQFIAAGGYDNRDYWTDNGWQWKGDRAQPWRWEDTDYTSDNQPVIGVTWYEATAFANWMHAHLVDELPQGYRIRLPTEAQWEVACAYDAAGNRHPYPWGEQDPTRELADFDDGSDPHGAAPVGGRPAGASAAGVQDMVGSVWERMTNSAAGYPAESGAVVADFATDEGDTPYRGGYWGSGDIRISVRCAARFRLNPVYDYHNIGFRLVLSP